MLRQVILVAGLLFGSGMCALIYQMVWLREFRFVFGASTLASAAVLSVFLGGLGAGGFWFGRHVDRNPRPLALYAYLELLIAASAALTPLLVWIAREFYVALGGVLLMGPVVATLVRLVLTACALAIPTFLMGGTLPAAARAVGGDEDAGRRRVAVLYGINTLGAVTGALLATFALLERLGADATLWAAAALNAIVGGYALWIARTYPAVFDKQVPVARAADSEVQRSGYVRMLIFATAAVVGLAFLLMELVWYRMLAPLLGGTTYTFGLILAVALLGIGLGGTAYALWGRKRPPVLAGLALTCILEALCVAIPFALGDQVAVLAGGLREWGALGFGGLVLSWSVVVGIVVLPTAVVAGYQFPLLIALLGPGARQLGLDRGLDLCLEHTRGHSGCLARGLCLAAVAFRPGRVATRGLAARGFGRRSCCVFVDERRANRAGSGSGKRKMGGPAVGPRCRFGRDRRVLIVGDWTHRCVAAQPNWGRAKRAVQFECQRDTGVDARAAARRALGAGRC